MRYFYSIKATKYDSLKTYDICGFIDLPDNPKNKAEELKVFDVIKEHCGGDRYSFINVTAFNPVWPSFDNEVQ